MPKKTKTIKKTDKKANKPWLKKIKPSVYKIGVVDTKKILLIVCEGQTEELYFKNFPVVTLKVEIIDLGGQSKIKLVEITQKRFKKNIYDEIWCVFDMDFNKDNKKQFSDFDNAIKKAKKLGYKVGYSNDAFELWFYLHYEYTDQKNHRSFYYKKLSRFWKINYVKYGKKRNFCNKIYQRLIEDDKSSQLKAIENAEKLFLNQKHLPYHKQNPVTLIYKLVKVLNDNIKR